MNQFEGKKLKNLGCAVKKKKNSLRNTLLVSQIHCEL